jgi:serpin B
MGHNVVQKLLPSYPAHLGNVPQTQSAALPAAVSLAWLRKSRGNSTVAPTTPSIHFAARACVVSCAIGFRPGGPGPYSPTPCLSITALYDGPTAGRRQDLPLGHFSDRPSAVPHESRLQGISIQLQDPLVKTRCFEKCSELWVSVACNNAETALLGKSMQTNLFTWFRRFFDSPAPVESRTTEDHWERLKAAAARIRAAEDNAAEALPFPALKLNDAGAAPAPTTESNTFALALYEQLSLAPGNLLFSPFSINTVVAMIYAGARGDTAAQMRSALGVSTSDESFHAKFGEILLRLGAAGQDPQELALANSVWLKEGVTLRKEYVEQVIRCYESELHRLDFNEPSVARAQMNQWVEEHTGNRIKDLVPLDCPDALTRLILINAVYFKGLWQEPFRKELTSDASFWLEDGSSVAVPMMKARLAVACAQGPGFRCINLPYKGNQMSMLVLLPDSRHGRKDLERALNARLLQSCLRAGTTVEVDLFLPRFRMCPESIDLNRALKAIGMATAFDPEEADFSGINGRQPPDEEALYIGRALHKAFVEVNEEGTEAAATMLGMLYGAAPSTHSPVFRADHPFVFGIFDRANGACIFLGRVLDPTRQT